MCIAFFVVIILPMIKFGHAQISVPKIGIPMLEIPFINPCVYMITR